MKIQVKNLGPLRQAEFELGDLTIICGGNNTGKTYATYALYGFLSFWREVFSIKVNEEKVSRLLVEGATEFNIHKYINEADDIIKRGCEAYTEQLPNVFAANEKHFTESHFSVALNRDDLRANQPFEQTFGAAKTPFFSISKKADSSTVIVSLIVEKEKIKIPTQVINRIIDTALKEIVFGHLFPNPFIASAERTGAAIFRKELNFARNRLLEQMGSKEKDIDPLDLLQKVYSDYALPVKKNVDFTRRLEELAKRESFLVKQHPELLEEFANIIGGTYQVTRNDELFYVPKGKKIKLTMDESSSAVRSLLDIGFYLRHIAKQGDLLMVDEPELNLHPENQRRVARLFSRLVNLGIKVFITTHSDYFIKELNTLIMLDRDLPHLRKIAKMEKYKAEELLSANKVRVYIAEEALVKLDDNQRKTKCHTLTPADIDPELGIEARSFDQTIEDMNRIQEEIVWGGEE